MLNKLNIKISFNKPYVTSEDFDVVRQTYLDTSFTSNGKFTKKCQDWLVENIGCKQAFVAHSCTAALEMAAILLDVQPGDEIIMPSYTFVSTANAFVLRGAKIVFVDIRPDTLNIDENQIEAAITERTKAIVPVHYAGVGCEMDAIMKLAAKYNVYVIEDAAQAIMSKYHSHSLGSLGHMATFSFHSTKNITSGEGGALIVNAPEFIERAEIIREKGTNRSQFFRGQVDKYTWVDIGSSYLPSEMTAALLWSQLNKAEYINSERLDIWQYYHAAFEKLEQRGLLRRPTIPFNCQHNAHMYYILLPNLAARNAFIRYLKDTDIEAVFHYIPLHSSPYGCKHGKTHGPLALTTELSDRLVRLPLWVGLKEHMDFVIERINKFFALQAIKK